MTITLGIDLVPVSCGNCGGTYAINAEYDAQQRETGGSWHCPYCRVGWGYRESEISRLKKQLEQREREVQRERQRHDQTKAALKDTERQRRAEKAAKTRIKNRVANGVCPCCRRSFSNLAAHMKTKHPDFANV